MKGTCSLYSLAAKSFLFPQYIAKTPLSLKLLYWMKPWAPGGEDHISHPESMCSWIPAPSITMVHKVLKIRLMNERNQWTCIYMSKHVFTWVNMYLQTAVTVKCKALLNKISLWYFSWISWFKQLLGFWKPPTFYFSLFVFVFLRLIIMKWILMSVKVLLKLWRYLSASQV